MTSPLPVSFTLVALAATLACDGPSSSHAPRARLRRSSIDVGSASPGAQNLAQWEVGRFRQRHIGGEQQSIWILDLETRDLEKIIEYDVTLVPGFDWGPGRRDDRLLCPRGRARMPAFNSLPLPGREVRRRA